MRDFLKKQVLTSVILVTYVMLIMGCSTTASIKKINGVTVNARIIRSDQEQIFIETGGGAEVAIPRKEITDMDHPGNVAATIGTILGVYGILNIAVGIDGCGENGRAASCAGVFLPAAVGFPVGIWGFWVWGNSRSATSVNRESITSNALFVPQIIAADEQPYYGGTLIFHF